MRWTLQPIDGRSETDAKKQRRHFIGLCVLLVVVVVFAFWPIRTHEFINLDDKIYITENPHVLKGLTLDGVRWAFGSGQLGRFHTGNWHPLTWISHMLDAQLYGANPAGHHWTNVQIHLACTLLFFYLLWKATGALGVSAIAAALWAIHPLRLESVAWASERKDILCALFYLLSIAAYGRYVRTRKVITFSLLALSMTAGLMAKPMIVTLPLALLVLDYWPLRRVQPNNQSLRRWSRLLWEKVPLLLLSAAGAAITLITQKFAGAVPDQAAPLTLRTANAAAAIGGYLGKMIWPADLAVFYPFPSQINWPAFAAGALSILVITLAAIHYRHTLGWLAAGWGWFLITLFPVLGLLQFGQQAMADRYTYIPMMGIVVAAVFLPWVWVQHRPAARRIAAVAGLLLVVGTLFGMRHQLGFWQNSVTLFERARQVSGDANKIMLNLAEAYRQKGNCSEAIQHYRQSIATAPRAGAYRKLAECYGKLGRWKEAQKAYAHSVKLDAKDPIAYHGLGNALGYLGRHPEAALAWRQALALDPDLPGSLYNLARFYYNQQESRIAATYLQRTLAVKANMAEAIYLLAKIRSGDPDPALRNGPEAVALVRRLGAQIGWADAPLMELHAAALAEDGQWEQAAQWAGKGARTARANGNNSLSEKLTRQQARYVRQFQAPKP